MTVVHEPRTVETSVETVTQETPEVRTLRRALPKGVDFRFEPGQWAQLAFPHAHEQKRSYSMSGSPFETAFGYSRALVQGPWVFVSGTTGYDYARMAMPDEIAACVCFLASELAGFITGAVLPVNGGIRMD